MAELHAAPGPTDADLLRGLAAGDRQAFEALYLRHWQDVVNFVRERCPSLDINAAEDIASDTLLRIWQLRCGLRITRDVPSYLRRVARSVVADRRRRRTATTDRKLPADVPSPLPSPDMAMERKDLARQIGRALASLAQSHRFALELTRLGLSAREIASQLACSENAARRVVQKARKNLAMALSRCGESCAVDDGRPEQCLAKKENLYCLKYLYRRKLRSG